MRLPVDKQDLDAARSFADVSGDDLARHYEGLLVWLQDMNWPVADPVLEVLARADLRLVPHVRAVLRGDDAVWKYWLIQCLLTRTRPEIEAELLPELERLATRPQPGDEEEEVDVVAAQLLRRSPLERARVEFYARRSSRWSRWVVGDAVLVRSQAEHDRAELISIEGVEPCSYLVEFPDGSSRLCDDRALRGDQV